MDAPHARAWFVTGTDTEVGKTFVTCALLHALRARGLRAIGMKPVAAGTCLMDGVERNEDVERLRAAANVEAPRALINPYCFASPVAPHIAAREEGVAIDPQPILDAFAALTTRADRVLVEGVGGFCVPLADGLDTAELARILGLPVILVVGMRLGCINHALLSAEAIRARGLALAGWVANQVDPLMLRVEENIDAIASRIGAPCLGRLPWQEQADPAGVAGRLLLPD